MKTDNDDSRDGGGGGHFHRHLLRLRIEENLHEEKTAPLNSTLTKAFL